MYAADGAKKGAVVKFRVLWQMSNAAASHPPPPHALSYQVGAAACTRVGQVKEMPLTAAIGYTVCF